MYKVYIWCENKRNNFAFYFPSQLSCTLSVLLYVGAFGMKEHIAETLINSKVVIGGFVDDGCHGGPEVFTGAGHVQPDPLPCGWRPPRAVDQDFGQPSIEGREGSLLF